MKKTLGTILALSAMFGGLMGEGMGLPKETQEIDLNDISGSPKETPIPNGCKEYFFNHLGDFINHNDDVYCFKCVAISDASAIKKFTKWRNSL